LIDELCQLIYCPDDVSSVVYFKDKYDQEPDGLFWSKPKFEFKVLFPVKFKQLNMRIAIPNIENNKLIVTNRDTVIFESTTLDRHFDVEIPYSDHYVFSTSPFIPPNDNRELGLYITKIKIIDFNEKSIDVPYVNMLSLTLEEITPINE